MIPSDRKRKLTQAAHSQIPLLQVITLMEQGKAEKSPNPSEELIFLSAFSIVLWDCDFPDAQKKNWSCSWLLCFELICISSSPRLWQFDLIYFFPPYSFHNSTISFGKISSKAAKGARFILSHNYLWEANGVGVKSASLLMFNEVF